MGNGLTSGNVERLAKAKHSWDIWFWPSFYYEKSWDAKLPTDLDISVSDWISSLKSDIWRLLQNYFFMHEDKYFGQKNKQTKKTLILLFK